VFISYSIGDRTVPSSTRRGKTHGSETISSGLVDKAKITPTVIFAGLCGAILWNLLTWLLGLPSSSSHALFGATIVPRDWGR